MNIKPLGDRVVLRQIESEETTKGGLVLPDTAKEKPARRRSIGSRPWPCHG